MGMPEQDRVEVAQPISQDRTMIRQSLLNGLLEFLDHNKHQDLPQKIFEVGEVVYLDSDAETQSQGVRMLAAAVKAANTRSDEVKWKDTYPKSIERLQLARQLDSANAKVEILAAALIEIATTREGTQDRRWYRERAERALVGAGLRVAVDEDA